MKNVFPASFSLILLFNNNTAATNNQIQKMVMRAVRVPNHAITIDGRLDEPAWQEVPAESRFTQVEPNPGEPATIRTSIQVAYDDHALFVGMYAYEENIGDLSYQLSRRDAEMPADWMGFMVDSYDDKRTCFTFGVYVSGVKYDAYFSDDVNQDANWDAVWDVKTRIEKDGWCAEFCIPLSQMRFPNKTVQTWGFEAMRFKNITNELDLWQYIPEDAPGWVSQFGRLEGIEGLPQPKRLQLLPYLVAKGKSLPEEDGNPFRAGPEYKPRMGGDLKYGLTSNITMDLTFNPDFGQIEADPSEVNLTAYETFFEEKRPFFLEGNSIFNYGFGVGDGTFGSETLFYSRRIGRRPHHEPDLPDDYYYDMPPWTNIISAAKISGKTSRGWSIGILEAFTKEMKADIRHGNESYREVVEPWTNYFITRIQKDFREGRSTLGGIITNVTRDISAPEVYNINKSAFTAGVDFSHKWQSDNFLIRTTILGSHIRGRKEAMIEAQESSARYYQRPDAGYLRYDPNRNSLSGYGLTFILGKIAGGHWRYGFGNITRSPGFETNDMGYLRQADISASFVYAEYEEYKPGKIFRRFNVNTDLFRGINYCNEHLFTGFDLNFHCQFLNYWGLRFGGVGFLEALSPELLRGGPSVLIPIATNIWFGFFSDERKKISIQTHGNYSLNEAGFSGFELKPTLTVRPSSRMDISLAFNYSTSTDDLQYIDEDVSYVDNISTTHYIIGRIKSINTYMMTRFNYSFTPDLTLQYYGMPFIFAGDFSNYREVIKPRARNYADRFQPYHWGNEDFNFKEYRSNLVLRWEYRPGSTFFLIWAHNKTHETEENGSFKLDRDIRMLFSGEAENVVLVKVNKWFDF